MSVRGHRQVADAGVGIHLGRGAAHDALDDLQPRARADGDLRVEQIELMPGRPAFDIEIAAEAQRMDRRAGRLLQRRDRGEVDDRDHLPRHVGKAVARRVQHLRRAAQFVGAEFREERLDRGAPLRRPQVAARGLAIFASGSSACGSLRRTRSAARPAGRSASASGTAAWEDSRARPGRSRTGRSRSHTSGRRARSAGPPASSAAAARASAPSPDSGGWPGFSRLGMLIGPFLTARAASLKALMKIKPVPLPARYPASYISAVGRSGEVRRPGAAGWARGSE